MKLDYIRRALSVIEMSVDLHLSRETIDDRRLMVTVVVRSPRPSSWMELEREYAVRMDAASVGLRVAALQTAHAAFPGALDRHAPLPGECIVGMVTPCPC